VAEKSKLQPFGLFRNRERHGQNYGTGGSLNTALIQTKYREKGEEGEKLFVCIKKKDVDLLPVFKKKEFED
jgi:hypothetical protein